MSKSKKDQKDDPDAPYTFSDEATKNKIKKHLADIKDVITEEDIANVKVPGEEDTPPPLPEEPKDDKEEENDPVKGAENGKPEGENKPITPWDVID